MKGGLRRAVFLDRDGVLNRAIVRNGKPHPPATLEDLQIPPDAPGALEALRADGFILIGITNQPDVARGTQRREVVEAINAALLAALPLHEILVCYHDDRDNCECRKPLPGLLFHAAARHGIAVSGNFMVGDRWKDIETGHRAHCATVLIGDGYAELAPGRSPDRRVHSLSEAAEWILTQFHSASAVRTTR
jgi:D-glycero-D-manno-heptose 1,7-bisphosphate phosphatase